jgi:Domain of unknown function (DUF4288)
MKWYLSKLVFHIVCGEGLHTPQFDEQLRLIYAEDELHAFQKARTIGDKESMVVVEAKQVHWKFVDVSELYPIADFIDGAEIYSKVREEDNAELYIRNTQKRAVQLLQDGLHKFTSINCISIGS